VGVGENKMKLITEELKAAFAKQGDTGELSSDQIKVIAKFFLPATSATWFATDYMPEENICFGYANLGNDDFAELGYFSIDELESLQSPFGKLRVERDLHFGEHLLSEIISTKGHI
jgi:hypothetical protein